MRVFAVSDLHLDYDENTKWLKTLSQNDYKDDVLILAGDISDRLTLLALCFDEFSKRFKQVLFVPGNHDLWTIRDNEHKTSFDKFHRVNTLAREFDVCLEPTHYSGLTIVPLLSWYDYSFDMPSEQLRQTWMDFRSCEWDKGLDAPEVTRYFLDQNEPFLNVENNTIISFSHFLPRIDVMPSYIPKAMRYIYPVLGSKLIDEQVRKLSSDIHVYGHSHVNRDVIIDNVRYINNAFAYPSEENLARKCLMNIYEG